MDQFAWSRQEAVSKMGIIMAVGGCIMLFVFLTMNKFTEYVDERKLLIFCGIIPGIVGTVVLTPVASYTPQMHGNFTIGGINGCK